MIVLYVREPRCELFTRFATDLSGADKQPSVLKILIRRILLGVVLIVCLLVCVYLLPAAAEWRQGPEPIVISIEFNDCLFGPKFQATPFFK